MSRYAGVIARPDCRESDVTAKHVVRYWLFHYIDLRIDCHSKASNYNIQPVIALQVETKGMSPAAWISPPANSWHWSCLRSGALNLLYVLSGPLYSTRIQYVFAKTVRFC